MSLGFIFCTFCSFVYISICMFVCVYECVCIYVCMCVYICIYVCVYEYIYIYICIYIYIYAYMYICISVCIYIYIYIITLYAFLSANVNKYSSATRHLRFSYISILPSVYVLLYFGLFVYRDCMFHFM